jgi:hypothetical protein
LGKNYGLGIKEAKRKRVKGSNMQASTGASVLHIWLQRNCRIFGGLVKPEESIKKAILWDLKKVFSKMGFKNSV